MQNLQNFCYPIQHPVTQFFSDSHFQLKGSQFKPCPPRCCSIWEAESHSYANASRTQESQRSPLTEAGQEPWRILSMVMPCLSQKDENRWLCVAAMQGRRRWSKSTLITEIRDTRGAAEQHLAKSVCRTLCEDDKPHVIYMSAFSFRYATPTAAHGWEFEDARLVLREEIRQELNDSCSNST